MAPSSPSSGEAARRGQDLQALAPTRRPGPRPRTRPGSRAPSRRGRCCWRWRGGGRAAAERAVALAAAPCSQPVAFAIAPVTVGVVLPSAASWSTARAVTSVSGSAAAASPSTQPWCGRGLVGGEVEAEVARAALLLEQERRGRAPPWPSRPRSGRARRRPGRSRWRSRCRLDARVGAVSRDRAILDPAGDRTGHVDRRSRSPTRLRPPYDVASAPATCAKTSALASGPADWCRSPAQSAGYSM